ncbi:hypothetical protein [Lutibacter sp.]|uniref:hypothetical protein n=1 Tax=Lutibacter sp. TaxID=1925666 RepID=UPI001A1CD038|nr:hypothetical protein [Lutibacter sp.]MBI9041005.1 outer membrane beta-barrel protein [Lutibacter sp.]
MRDYKNIDRIFQENLKDFEVFPPNKAWTAIEKQIAVQPVKSRVPFWLKIASIAAIFVLFFSIGTIYLMPESKFSINSLLDRAVKNDTLNKDVTAEIENKNKKAVKKITTTTNLKLKASQLSSNINKSENEFNNDEVTTRESSKNTFGKFSASESNKKPFKNINESRKAPNRNSKFTVATIFAPIYISSLGDGTGVDSQFSNNASSGNSSYSYGVKFAYELNNKFTLQSGVNLINLGFTTNDIYVNPSVAVVGFSNLSAEPLLSRSTTMDTAKSNSIDSNKGSLNQVFGYVEIPIELKYSVTDGKFGVNLVGGFSTLLLNRDEVFIETNDFSQSLGSSNNLRSINFSGNIGVDIDYLIHKNLYINVSPMFKMQTNTFSKNSGSLQPYYLGVYTGLNYKF